MDEWMLTLEIFAVVTGILFIVLMIRQNIWCWSFGILSSAASIVLFYYTKLYSEAILYFFYVLVGIYGWIVWHRKEMKEEKVRTAGPRYHILAVILGITGASLLGFFFRNYTDAARPLADATSTAFSFVASFMEAHKILSAWIFWICINGFSVWLYLDRDLKFYSGLMVVYFLLSIYGYRAWKKSMKAT